jgi:hypothetical protein
MRRLPVFLLLLGCGQRSTTLAMHEQNNSGQDGTATLIDLGNGRIDVTEVLKPSTFPGPQQSHIHKGHCDDLREIEYYIFQFTGGDGGQSFAVDGGTITFHNIIPAAWSDIFDGDHAINVHDPRDNGLYVSCGDLTP